MHFFLNPFKKQDNFDVSDVVVPLEQASHRNDNGERGLTIDILKEEIDADLQAGGVNTAYDRT